MTNMANEMLTLMAELAKLKTPDDLVSRFTKGVNGLYPRLGMRYHPDSKEQSISYIEVKTERNDFGCFAYSGHFDHDSDQNLVEKSVSLLAIFLENMDRQTNTSPASKKISSPPFGENEEQFRLLFDQAADAIFWTDIEGNILEANQRAYEYLGYVNEDLLQMSGSDLIAYPKDIEKIDRLIKQMPHGSPITFNAILRKKDGSEFPAEVRLSVLAVSGMLGVLGFVRDITERIEIEETVRHERDVLERIMETSPIGIGMFNSAGEITFLNKRGEEILQVKHTKEDAFPLNISEWNFTDFDGNPFPEDQLPFPLVRASGKSVYNVCYAIDFPDGSKRLLSVNAAPLLDVFGQFEGMVAAIEDVTEKVINENKHKKQQERYKQLFSAMLDGYALHEIICDENGKPVDYQFLEANPAFERMTGLKRDDIVGERVLKILPDLEPSWIEIYGKVALTGQSVQFSQYSKELGKYFEVTAFSTAHGRFATVFIDVTERMLAEQNLALFKAAMDFSSDAIGMIDPAGRLWYQNAAFNQMFGDQPVETPDPLFVNPEIIKALSPVVRGGSDWSGEVQMYGRAGQILDVLLRVYPVKNEKGVVVHIVGVHLDITERKRMENKLRTSEAHMLQAQKIAKAGHYIYDIEKDVWENSAEIDAICEIDSGYKRDMASWVEIIHPEFREELRTYLLDDVLGKKHVFNKEYAILTIKDKKEKWVHQRGELILDEQGTVVQLIGTLQDITQRKLAEAELHKIETLLKSVVAQSPIPMIVAGADCKVILFNPASLSVLGIEKDPDMISGVDLSILEDKWIGVSQEGKHYSKEENPLIRSLKGQAINNLIWKVIRQDGTERWVSMYATPIYDNEKLLIAGFAMFPDITDHMMIELERERLIEELEGKNAELERFTYTISHDLKSPMITIHGFLDLLISDVRNHNLDEVEGHYQRVIDAISKMDQLLKELLELSRIGRIMNAPNELQFNTVVENAVDLTRGILNKRQIDVTVQANMPVVVGDMVRLREVLTNLIENASKFMGEQPSPKIEIGALIKDGRPVFYVRDNGMGIEPQYHQKIFNLFDKLDAQSDGSGVGLSLVKRIIEVHGGRIWIESEGKGKGTTFYFTLPSRFE